MPTDDLNIVQYDDTLKCTRVSDRDYHTGDLVSYCNRPAMVTAIDASGTVADIIYLDGYTAITVLIAHLHYLGAGQHYLREAQAFARTLMLVEKLGNIKEEHNE